MAARSGWSSSKWTLPKSRSQGSSSLKDSIRSCHNHHHVQLMMIMMIMMLLMIIIMFMIKIIIRSSPCTACTGWRIFPQQWATSTSCLFTRSDHHGGDDKDDYGKDDGGNGNNEDFNLMTFDLPGRGPSPFLGEQPTLPNVTLHLKLKEIHSVTQM